MLDLLKEIEYEATKMNKKDFFFGRIIYTSLQKLIDDIAYIDDDVEFNLRITDEATYLIYLDKLHKTANMFISL